MDHLVSKAAGVDVWSAGCILGEMATGFGLSLGDTAQAQHYDMSKFESLRCVRAQHR